MSDDRTIHYITTIKIEKVVRIKKESRNSAITAPVEYIGREISELTKIIVKDEDLGDLIKKAKGHLDLVDDSDAIS